MDLISDTVEAKAFTLAIISDPFSFQRNTMSSTVIT